MTATVDAVLSTVQGDGGGDGKIITTPGTMTGKRLLVFVGSSTNADTISAPGSGTWAEVDSGGDKVITTSGGQLRTFEGRSLAASTAYAFTLSGGRRTIGALVISGHDDSGASMVDVAGSLESAAGSTHAPPSVTPTTSSELVVDCLMFRQFNPDTSTGSPPSTGLTWTEHLDTRGADGNNNVQINLGSATAGSSGVAISTAPWNTDDPFEPSMVMRVVIKSAAGAGGAAPTGLAIPIAFGSPTVTLQSVAPTGLAVPISFGSATATRQSAAPAGLAVPVGFGAPTVALNRTAAPTGLVIPVSFGSPTVTAGAFPAGLAIPVALGSPTVTRQSAALTGLAVPVSLGAPTATLARSAMPAGLAIPVALGAPQVGAQAPYATAVLSPGASAPATLTPGAAAAVTLTPSAITPATLTPDTL